MAGQAGLLKTDTHFLISVVGISNTVGRIVSGWLADLKWTSALGIISAGAGFLFAIKQDSEYVFQHVHSVLSFPLVTATYPWFPWFCLVCCLVFSSALVLPLALRLLWILLEYNSLILLLVNMMVWF